MSNPQDEAIHILGSVRDKLLTGNANLKAVLRSCFHVCELLGWDNQLVWFQQELYGYPVEVILPWYRRNIKGRTKWLTCGGIYATVHSVTEEQFETEKEPTIYVSMDVGSGIDWILSVAQGGYIESTGRKSSKYLRTLGKDVETEEVCIYDKQTFQVILKNIENLAFNFVSKSYSILCYGDALQDIWQAYRAQVEECLIPIGLGKHLDAVRKGLNSNNPQDWRAAMWSCRDILHDLATYLWQDPRETYEHLPGKGKDGKLKVTNSDYVNRLGAYLHYKGITAKTGAYIRAEMDRIYHSIDTLNHLDSTAHSPITLRDIRTAAIGTYIILGELVTRTDMKPVVDYGSL